MTNDQLLNYTLDVVQTWYDQGVINQDSYDYYCYMWRNSCYRWSSDHAAYEDSTCAYDYTKLLSYER